MIRTGPQRVNGIRRANMTVLAVDEVLEYWHHRLLYEAADADLPVAEAYRLRVRTEAGGLAEVTVRHYGGYGAAWHLRWTNA